jgi:arylsulfatase A-like enzyme
VVFTSDNGPVVDDGYADGSVENRHGHQPAGPFRGGKYSIYEGGTRLPMIVRWPARIAPGGVSDALISQVDFTGSMAALTGQSLADRDAPDSFNVLPALLGESKTGRDHLVEHAGRVALRSGPWKLIPGAAGKTELYDLATDPGETKNAAAAGGGRVAQMSARLEQIRQAGRSRP